ncbi:S66 peptidase family protein [Jannaschia sp. R86511]|uniref:S66 family peptidase n=1 Tax=Jannaschia sp. R86511 TaxID=3093853 RepID=UPI0036D2F697
MIRFPAPLRPGDTIGVTAPSSGVPAALRPRLDLAVAHLRERGYEVRLGACLADGGVVSAPARERADELSAMLLDPTVRAVVPPWGGELAVEVLPHLDPAALRAAEATWLVGYSDVSTLTLALTTTTGTASVHAPNLMDTPDPVPEPLLPWLDAVTAPTGSVLVQGGSTHHAGGTSPDWADDPGARPTLDRPGGWSLLDPGAGEVHTTGRLLGGCLETIAPLAGTPYGDVAGFVADHAPEGLLLHLEASESHALDVARLLWGLRLAGWFDRVNAVLVGRTRAPAAGGFSQADALRSALADLDLPVVLDVDLGHVPPQLSLVQGALADLTVTAGTRSLAQTLA